jgi:uncharacterized protein involved in exopolysaccharide biosynthesis
MASLRRLEEHYRVQGMNESNTLRVSFQHTDPEIAATVVNTAVTRFMQKHLEAFSGPKIADFYFEKVRAYGDKLNDIENGIRDFQTSNATVSFEEQRSLLLREAAELDKEIDGFERRRSGLTQRIRALEEEMAAQAQQIPLDEESEAESIEAQLLQLRLRERELRSQFRETDRQVVSVREQIAVVERFLSDREGASGKRVRVGRNQIYDGLENGLVHARVELAEMEAVIAPATRRRAKLLSELKLLPVREQHLGELLREKLRELRSTPRGCADVRRYGPSAHGGHQHHSIGLASGEADPARQENEHGSGRVDRIGACLGNRLRLRVPSYGLGYAGTGDGTARDSCAGLDSLSGADEIWTSD